MRLASGLASALAMGVALAALAAAPSMAQKPKPGPAPLTRAPMLAQTAAWPKGQYHRLDNLPDWGGVWSVWFPGPPPTSGGKPPPRPTPQLKGKYLEDYQAFRKATQENGGVAPKQGSNCLPPGMPGIMGVFQYPIEFLFTPGRVTILAEAWGQWRRIYTDGRPHPDDPEPSFQGDSIGHWEGDTLVVDTVAIKDAAKIQLGMGHSDKLHITERLRQDPKDPDKLTDTIMLDDPEALAAPYTNVVTYKRTRDGTLLEFVCAENDRNPVDAQGHTVFEGIQK